MAFRIDSDNRWKSYGGLAGVFVFCSIAITGTLWHSRPHRLVRGEDAAAVAAAAYERRWALWASGDPASLPPRFGPSAATAALRRARIDFSGLASGSPAPPLEWDGDPRSWQPKYFKIRPPARDYTDEGHRITWWFGGTGGWESAASSCTVVGSDRSNELHNAFSDTGGVFRAHGFEVSPPFFEGTVNPWECGIIPGHSGGWPRGEFDVTVRPLPDFDWPTNGAAGVFTVTNTPGRAEALWPEMHGDFLWNAARSLRSSLLSDGPWWLSGEPGGTLCTGYVANAGPGSAAVVRVLADWARSPCDGELAGPDLPWGLVAGVSGAVGVDALVDRRVPGGGWWRALTGSTNPAGYSAGGTPLENVPNTNLLWECLGAASAMSRAASGEDQWSLRDGPVETVEYYLDDGAEVWSCSTNGSGDMSSASVTYGWAFRREEVEDAPPGADPVWDYGPPPWESEGEWAEASAPAGRGALALARGGGLWPCASACASGLVSRVRAYSFPSGTAGFPAGFAFGAREWIPLGGTSGVHIPPLARPALMLGEADPAAWADTNTPVSLDLPALPSARDLVAAARDAAAETANYDAEGEVEVWDAAGRTNMTLKTFTHAEERRAELSLSLLAGGVYTVADFAFSNLTNLTERASR